MTKRCLTCLLALTLSLLIASSAIARDLAGAHALGLRGGYWGESGGHVKVGSTTVDVEGGSGAGGLGYIHWFDEAWALDLSLSALAQGDVEVSAGDVSTSGATFTSILIGVRRYLPPASFGTRWRPYLNAAMGPCIGDAGSTRAGDVVEFEASTQLVFAGYAGGGVDLLLGRHVLLEMGMGYLLSSSYDPPLGTRDDVSGARLDLGLSLVWGGK